MTSQGTPETGANGKEPYRRETFTTKRGKRRKEYHFNM